MILHTIIPPEQIFLGDAPRGGECRRMHNNFIQGVNMNGVFTISRLISTDPKMYLDPRYAPGGRIAKQE